MQQTLVYTPGVWDMLHMGHVTFLERAKALGDRLIVGVPSDAVVHEDKGQFPIIGLGDRLYMLRALKCVDLSVPYYQLEFVNHLIWFNPTILVVGETWGSEKRHLDAEDWAASRGKQIVKLPYMREISTSKIKDRLR